MPGGVVQQDRRLVAGEEADVFGEADLRPGAIRVTMPKALSQCQMRTGVGCR